MYTATDLIHAEVIAEDAEYLFHRIETEPDLDRDEAEILNGLAARFLLESTRILKAIRDSDPELLQSWRRIPESQRQALLTAIRAQRDETMRRSAS